MDLHGARQFVSLGMAGTAPQPIAFAEITAWLDFAEVEDDETRREIAEYVRAMDVEFRKWAAEKRAV